MRLLCSSMKNEGPDILEWVSYHLSIGFDHILIATNDCEDGSDRFIQSLEGTGQVTHLDNVLSVGQRPQYAALRKMVDHPRVKNSDYMMVLDADEFLNIHIEDGQLSGLCNQLGADDILCINWACYGAKEEPDAEWVTDRFLYKSPMSDVSNGTFKSLIRVPHRFSQFLPHAPGPLADGSDLKIQHDYGERQILAHADYHHSKLRRIETELVCYRLAQVNHYTTKSAAEFVV